MNKPTQTVAGSVFLGVAVIRFYGLSPEVPPSDQEQRPPASASQPLPYEANGENHYESSAANTTYSYVNPFATTVDPRLTRV